MPTDLILPRPSHRKHPNRPTGGNCRPGFRVHPAVQSQEHHSSVPGGLGALREVVPVARPNITSGHTRDRGAIRGRSFRHAQPSDDYPANLGNFARPSGRRSGVANHVCQGSARPGRNSAHEGNRSNRQDAILVEDLRRMVGRLPGGLLGVRDRVLLLIGFCGAFRRSELVALDAGDVQVTREGLVVTIRRSKTDQEGEGRKIGIPYASHVETCPIRSLQDWLEKSGITEGPLFRPINRHGKMAAIRLSAAAVGRDREEIRRRRGPGCHRVRRSQPEIRFGY